MHFQRLVMRKTQEFSVVWWTKYLISASSESNEMAVSFLTLLLNDIILEKTLTAALKI